MKCRNANNIARNANSHLTSNDDKLHPLVSLKTNKAIEKFPATSKDIEKLKCKEITVLINRVNCADQDTQ
jgi:hypothetical protein